MKPFPMLTLGIETSCDETAVALLRSGGTSSATVLAEQISSQSAVHAAYGGVVPELAAREHLSALPLLFAAVLKDAGVVAQDIDLIGVTRGPGLVGCLLVGISFARAVSLGCGAPLMGVNHIEGHLLAPMLDVPELTPPYLALVVSGGHTEIVEVQGVGAYIIHARTMDDAAGEAFDKSAHLLGLEYPGGPRLAKLADSVPVESGARFKLPRIMPGQLGVSFSGLKTAVALLLAREREAWAGNETVRAALASAIQEAIVDTLIDKLSQVIRSTKIFRVVVTGGVSANLRLRRRVGGLQVDGQSVESFFPLPVHSMDNGAMIAFAALRRNGLQREPLGRVGGSRLLTGGFAVRGEALSRWPVESISATELREEGLCAPKTN